MPTSPQIRLEVSGDKEIERLLNGWKESSRNRIMRPGISKASRLVSRAAKAEVSVESGLLRKSIGVKIRTYKGGNVVGVIGPRRGFKKPVHRASGGKQTIVTKKNVDRFHDAKGSIKLRDPAKYAHLVEGGTAPHALGRGSRRFVRTTTKGIVTLASGQKVRRTVNVAVSPGKQEGRTHPGAKPKPFLEPAFRKSLPMARQIILAEAKRNVIKEARRLVRRAGYAA